MSRTSSYMPKSLLMRNAAYSFTMSSVTFRLIGIRYEIRSTNRSTSVSADPMSIVEYDDAGYPRYAALGPRSDVLEDPSKVRITADVPNSPAMLRVCESTTSSKYVVFVRGVGVDSDGFVCGPVYTTTPVMVAG